MDDITDAFNPRESAAELKRLIEALEEDRLVEGLLVRESGNSSGWRYKISDSNHWFGAQGLFIQQGYGKTDDALILKIEFKLGAHSEEVAREIFFAQNDFKNARLSHEQKGDGVTIHIRVNTKEKMDRAMERIKLACCFASSKINPDLGISQEAVTPAITSLEN